MSFRTFWLNLVACLLFTAGATLLLQPWSPSRSGAAWLEADVQSDESGLATLYVDVGHGINDGDSAVQAVAAGKTAPVRFALPSGRLSSLEWVVLDRDVRMTLSRVRVVDRSGKTLARVAAEDLVPAAEIREAAAGMGQLRVTSVPQATRPRLRWTPAEPLVLPRSAWWIGPVLIFVILIILTGCLDSPRLPLRGILEQGVLALRDRANASPAGAVAAVSLCATLLANYPVVFQGRSFVSPGLGTALLYGSNPWVPGFQSIARGNSNSADIDALMWQHVPYSMLEHEALFRDGELPLWDRYNSAGTPLLAQGQSGIGDPLHLIPLLANGASWAWDVKFVLTKFLLSLGVGLCVWRLTRHLPASCLVAVSVQFIGFFVYRINHPAIFSVCYAPWILYAWLLLAEAGSLRSAVWALLGLLGANLAELASGTVKEADMLLLCLNFSGVFVLLSSPRPWGARLKLLGLAVFQGLVFVLIGSPLWYTFYRGLRHAYTMYNAPQAFQLQPGMLAGLFDEAFYRPFQYFSNVINPSANFFLLLGVLWVLIHRRSALAGQRVVLALLASALLPAALAFGLVPPGLITRIPYLGNILHLDNTFSCVLIILLAVVAGAGWKAALEHFAAPPAKTSAAWPVFIALLAVYAAYLGTAQAIVRGFYAPQTWGSLIRIPLFVHLYGMSLILGAALLLWALPRAARRDTRSAGILLLAAVGFAALHWRHGLQAASAFPGYAIIPGARVDLRARSPAIDAIAAVRHEPERAVGFVDNLFPGWSGAYGLEGVEGADSLINPYYRELLDAAGMERVWDWRFRLQDRDVPAVRPILDMLNVRYYLDYPAGARHPRSGLTDVLSSDMEAYESPTWWPRAYFTDRVAVYRDLPQYVSWLREARGVPFAAIQHADWIRMNPAPPISGLIDGRTVRKAESYRLSANTTSFRVSATGPGFIVLGEAFEVDNFRATLNGMDVPYVRMNHCFKGIYVDAPGTYEVEFSYWPRGLTTSLWVGGLGIGLVVAEVLAALALKSGTPAAGWQAL